jgi:hypothetical protein
MEPGEMPRPCLVHLASGVGNIVFATPLLLALDELGYEVHVCLDADYAQTADLLQPWSVVRAVHGGGLAALVRRSRGAGGSAPRWDTIVPAVPPFSWPRFARAYAGPVAEANGGARIVTRPPDRLFALDEQAFYLSFARALGYPADARPVPSLPIGARESETRVGAGTVVLAPGCKTGTMAAKRWPHFAALAARFDDVVVVGTGDDMRAFDGTPLRLPAHVRSFSRHAHAARDGRADGGGGDRGGQRQRPVARRRRRRRGHADAVRAEPITSVSGRCRRTPRCCAPGCPASRAGRRRRWPRVADGSIVSRGSTSIGWSRPFER